MKKPINIQWPFKGLDEANAFTRQRGGQGGYSTASCMNVIGYDPTTGRNRGSARAGTEKFCPDRVNGAAAGQCVAHVVGAPEVDNRVTGASGSPASALRLTGTGEARDLGPATSVPVGDRTTTIAAIAGGDIATISTSGVTAIESGEDAFSSLPSVIYAESFFQDLYFVDGANYKYYDVSANVISTWDARNGGEMPKKADDPKDITGATNASPIVITITGHGYITGDQVTISGVLGNDAANGEFVVTRIDADTFSLDGSTGDGAYTSGGTSIVRRVGSRCKLIAIWGGRVVLSGLSTDPNNVFMSAVGDPFNWDYSPAVQTVQQAVAGNVTSGYGKNSDIVTALIPYTDDILLIGGTHSIRKFVGNPAEGGVNVNVTDITGIAEGRAWCQSPEGVIYFFGSRGGVYQMDPEGGIPSRITALSIDERLANVDLDNNVIRLIWDDRSIAVRIYITPTSGGTTTHYVWDVRNEAWWPRQYANSDHDPFAVHLLYGGSEAERRVLEYGQDGYIREVDVDSPSDDGEPINSFILLGPFSQMMLMEIDATLSETSGQVNWSIRSASSLEKALTGKPRSSGRFRRGRNTPQWPRTYIEEGYLKLEASGPWAMEKIMAVMDEVNETTRRVMRSFT
jgi:hypothetical protein